jgi:hypothetical protein
MNIVRPVGSNTILESLYGVQNKDARKLLFVAPVGGMVGHVADEALLEKMKLASMVKSITYRYVHPSDRRETLSYPIQSVFLGTTFRNLTSLCIKGAPEWENGEFITGLARNSHLASRLTRLSLVGAAEFSTKHLIKAFKK